MRHWTDPHGKDIAIRRVRKAGVIVALVFAATAAWAGRYEMTHDGMSYLDMSRAVLSHDWARAINGLWSPLYPWLLALGFLIVRPGPQWEFPTVHLVNFLIFVVSLICFDFFLRQLLLYRRERATQYPGDTRLQTPEWIIAAVGYTFFIWSSLNLIELFHVTPDLVVATFVYLSAGWLLRSRLEFQRSSPFAFLGLALGLGYFAKAPMFPLGLVFLALTVIPVQGSIPVPRVLLRTAVALTTFSVVAGTLVLALFLAKGRVTLGDSSWLNYAMNVNRVPIYHYQGGRPGLGTLVHPTRRLYTKPDAYEFATPIEATYPPWFDPAYWYQGLSPRFDPKGHLLSVRWSLRVYNAEGILHHWWPSTALFILVAAFFVRSGWLRGGDLGHYAILWVPALSALVMYAPIHLEPRFVAAFMPLLWLGLMSSVRLPAGTAIRKATLVLAVVLLMHIVPTIISTAQVAYSIGQEMVVPGASRRAEIHLRVADGLKQMGVAPGERVAVIGPGIRAYWAWLARVRIVAEVPVWAVQDFWAADAQAQRTILDRFSEAGAKIAVYQPDTALDQSVEAGAQFVGNPTDPRSAPPAVSAGLEAMGWQRIGMTDYYVLRLKK